MSEPPFQKEHEYGRVSKFFLFVFSPNSFTIKSNVLEKKHTKTTINVVLLCFGVPLVPKIFSKKTRAPFVEKWFFRHSQKSAKILRWHLPVPKLRGEREGCVAKSRWVMDGQSWVPNGVFRGATWCWPDVFVFVFSWPKIPLDLSCWRVVTLFVEGCD